MSDDTINSLNDTVNDTVKAGIDTVNDTVKANIDTVNDTVFSLIKQNKRITAAEIAQQSGISLSTVRRKIKQLKDEGFLKRVGSDKAGHWEVTNS